jgi:hypothetical protein
MGSAHDDCLWYSQEARRRAGVEGKVAREICRAVTDDCVMDTDPDRPPCTEKNCRMVHIAKAAIEAARR